MANTSTELSTSGDESGRGELAGSAVLCLTPLGAALLGRDDGDWPDDPDPAPLHVVPLLGDSEEPSVLIQASPGLSPSHRFSLEGIVPPDPATPDHYRLSRSHFLRALQRGHTVTGMAGFLERASGEPLPAPVMGALYRWEDDLNRVTIRQTVLLQTRDPALLRDLASQRRVRETLGKTLNERTVEVRADRLDALVRRLAWRDVIPRLDLGADLSRSAAGRAKTTESENERAALAIALRIYAHLADELGLSARPASALARHWREGLPLRLRDAVERQVEQILDALHRASPLEMEDRLPEPTGPLLEVLESAIRERATVEIEYYSAGRAHQTRRHVDPLRLEWRGDVVYLVAYCHLREDERVFRVDRIESAAKAAAA